jgi:hypothetical protein
MGVILTSIITYGRNHMVSRIDLLITEIFIRVYDHLAVSIPVGSHVRRNRCAIPLTLSTVLPLLVLLETLQMII